MSKRTLIAPATLVVISSLALGCGSPPPAQDQNPAISSAPQPTLSDVAGLGVANAAMPSPGLVTAGQLTVEQLDALAEMGYDNFISLRPTSEDGAGWEEEHVAGADVSFNRIPVQGGAGLTRDNVERLAQLLDGADAENTVLYCGSSNRVGSLLALKAYWLDGVDPEEALEIGRAAGMRSLEGRVTELLSEPR